LQLYVLPFTAVYTDIVPQPHLRALLFSSTPNNARPIDFAGTHMMAYGKPVSKYFGSEAFCVEEFFMTNHSSFRTPLGIQH
jgi:hypothetical protein